jgi:hypothetical protein
VGDATSAPLAAAALLLAATGLKAVDPPVGASFCDEDGPLPVSIL